MRLTDPSAPAQSFADETGSGERHVEGPEETTSGGAQRETLVLASRVRLNKREDLSPCGLREAERREDQLLVAHSDGRHQDALAGGKCFRSEFVKVI